MSRSNNGVHPTEPKELSSMTPLMQPSSMHTAMDSNFDTNDQALVSSNLEPAGASVEKASTERQSNSPLDTQSSLPQSGKLLQLMHGVKDDSASDSPRVSVPRITPEEWLHLFDTTGLCQGYDLESEKPRPAGSPLFVVKNRNLLLTKVDSKPSTPTTILRRKKKFPDKPVFLVDDQTRTVTEETFTERHKHMVEMGFSAGDLAISVPYVNASIKAEKKEREQSEQAVKTVFLTTREEFPRCRIDIRASLQCGYLAINPVFIAEVERVTLRNLDRYDRLKKRVDQLRNAYNELWAQIPLATLEARYGALLSPQNEDRSNLETNTKPGSEGTEAQHEFRKRRNSGLFERDEEPAAESPRAHGADTTSSRARDGDAAATPRSDAPETEFRRRRRSGLFEERELAAAPPVAAPSAHVAAGPGGESAFKREGEDMNELRSSDTCQDSGLRRGLHSDDTGQGSVTDANSGSAEEPIAVGEMSNGSHTGEDTLPGACPEESKLKTEPSMGVVGKLTASDSPPPVAPVQAKVRTEVEPPRVEDAAGSDAENARASLGCFCSVFGGRQNRVVALSEQAGNGSNVNKLSGPRAEKVRTEDPKWKDVGRFFNRLKDALAREYGELQKERRRIVVQTQELIKQFGAVWVENITMGAQSTSTREQTHTVATTKSEKERSMGGGLAAQYGTVTVGGNVSHGKSQKAESKAAESTHKESENAMGGDTIAFREKKSREWVQSIRMTENWRIISYRNLRLLSEVPGLDQPCKNGGEMCPGTGSGELTVRDVLKRRLAAVEQDVAEVEARKDPPRRDLGGQLRFDLQGSWYGFECSHQPGGFDRAHHILKIRINQVLEFEAAAASGLRVAAAVRRAAAKGVMFRGIGEGDESNGLFLIGEVFEVDDVIKHSPYEPRGHVCMDVHCPMTSEQWLYVGHLDRIGMHGTWRNSVGQNGTWGLAPATGIQIAQIDEPWTFMEREAHINEPLRRWLLPSDAAVCTAESRGGDFRKLIDVQLLTGTWQGYQLSQRGARGDAPVLRETLNTLLLGPGNDDIDDWNEVDPDAPPAKLLQVELPATWRRVKVRYFEIVIERCEVVGGAVGRRRLRVTGTGRLGKARFELQGSVLQVPPKSTADDDYPYLARVDLTLTFATGRRSARSDGSTAELRGHVDHLGMHGFADDTCTDAIAGSTFALMPTKLERSRGVNKPGWSCFGIPSSSTRQQQKRESTSM